MYCRFVWSQSEDGELFISWGILNTAPRAGECKRRCSCIIQLLYVQAFRCIRTCKQACTHAAAAGSHRKPTAVQETSLSLSLSLETFLKEQTERKREEKCARDVCRSLCDVWVDFFFFFFSLTVSVFSSYHTLFLHASHLGSTACGGSGGNVSPGHVFAACHKPKTH